MIDFETLKIIALCIFSALSGFTIGSLLVAKLISDKLKSKNNANNHNKDIDIKIKFDDIKLL